eukprot:2925613-Prymnesium_polylepis.1
MPTGAEPTLILADGVYYGGSFSISRNVTIRASNTGQTILDGQNARRVLLISSGTVRLEGLIIRNGQGGDIYMNGGTLHAQDCSITGNSASVS